MQFDDLGLFQDKEVLVLTTTGRRSGQRRRVKLWFVVYQSRLYVMAEHRHATGWVKNLRKDPLVSASLAGNRLPARVRILVLEQDRAEWRAVTRLFRQKYGWGEGLPVALSPIQSGCGRG